MSVEFTSFGLVVLPISAIMVFFPSYWLIALVLFFSPFHAATVININLANYSFGIQPAYFIAVIYLVKKLLTVILSGKVRFSKQVVRIYTPLFLFLIYITISVIVIPYLAKGIILVQPYRSGDSRSLIPLKFSATNISQTLYVYLSIFLAISISHEVAKHPKLNLIFQHTYLVIIFIVCVIGIYQVLAWRLGLYFPYDLLYTNPAKALAGIRQVSVGVKRLSSTFAEPSNVGQFLAGALAFVLWNFQMSKDKLTKFTLTGLLAIVIIATALTTSTTAYVSFFAIVLFNSISSLKSKQAMRQWFYFVSVLIIVILFAIFVSDSFDTIANIARRALFEKNLSNSFETRMLRNSISLDILISSFGLGAGWGSHSSSSLLFTLIGNAGLWGTILAFWFFYRLYRHGTSNQGEQNHLQIKRALSMSIFFILLAGIIAKPDFSVIGLWINIGWFTGIGIKESNK